MFDGLLVTFGSAMDRLLWGVAGAAQRLPHGGDADGEVEHAADQGANPGKGPALILVPASCGRALLQLVDQLLHLGL